jgi:hypothetical protein
MEHHTLDFGPYGVIPLHAGAVLRVGHATCLGVDLALPLAGVHLLCHGRADGVLIVNCSEPPHLISYAGQTLTSQFLRVGDSIRIGTLECKIIGSPMASAAPLASVRARKGHHGVAFALVAVLGLSLSVWGWEAWRVQQRERVAAFRLADQSMAMLAESIFGGGEGTAAYYDNSLCEKWLDRILTVDVRREASKAIGYTFHLDEDPVTSALVLTAHGSNGFWRNILGLRYRDFTCDLTRPQLLSGEGDELDWEWLGGESTGWVVPRRLQRKGISPGLLYHAERYRGFTWPLREMAQRGEEDLLRSIANALSQLPAMTLQAFPDRTCEKALWQALANLGEEETFMWETSPEQVPSIPSRRAATIAMPIQSTEPAPNELCAATAEPTAIEALDAPLSH